MVSCMGVRDNIISDVDKLEIYVQVYCTERSLDKPPIRFFFMPLVAAKRTVRLGF